MTKSGATTLVILVLLGLFLGASAFAEVANDELEFEASTEAGVLLNLDDEISKQEQQIRVVLSSLKGEKTDEIEIDRDPNKSLTVTLISKK
ncbi:MAG: hypothetical protein HRT45_03235 [Bdellovibrionales bacterium]|nr:hypothetical protein [Bdellovibrionales bacterium]